MNITKETVTPRKALDWLKRNAQNRPISTTTVKNYARAMTAGAWQVNGDCIRFNGNGDMIDGQHRLTACVQADKSFETYVARGLEHAAFDTIDQGCKRTIGHVFARAGYEHYTTLASAVRNLWRYENGYLTKCGSLRPDEANAIIENHPGIHAAVSFTRHAMSKKSLIHPGVNAFLVYITSQLSTVQSEEFWNWVLTGEGLNKTMPAYLLRERLIANLSSQAKIDHDMIAALAIKAWNFHRAGKPCKTLKWLPSEEFPVAV